MSGLIGSGLVLAVNGSSATVTVQTGDTTVNLASGLATGTAYTVTVQTQPTGETCSVAGGSGTVASANIANVVVTCSAQAYSLGGSITNLIGTGLILANGTDTVTVPPNAPTFTLPTSVAFGSSYTVSVNTQPAGQACQVAQSSASGTMPAGNVTTVSVTCTNNSFTIGGQINGLGNNTGLVLTDNGADSYSVAAGALSFTMPTALSFGGNYLIAVQSSPAGLICTPSSNTAAVPAANVTSVLVTCNAQSYPLSGTISNLSAGGLVLANGSDTLNVTSGSTTFQMPMVAFESPYSLQVQTQPTGETCSIDSLGTGSSLPLGGVTNVAITCGLNNVTIGGSITGLTTTGLVLLDNNANPTPISANANTFTLNGTIASPAGTYAVTRQSQPAAVNCTITGGSGPVSGADITSVGVTCGAGTEDTAHLYAFGSGTDAADPASGLIVGADQLLYGVTPLGGVNGDGALYQYNPSTHTEADLYDFFANSTDAGQPSGALVQASSGVFYGASQFGGTNPSYLGAIFSFTLGTGGNPGTEQVLYRFAGGAGDGQRPTAGLILASDGNLYGVTAQAGANNGGVLFEYNLTTSTYSVLHSFGGAGDADAPSGGLVQGSDGKLYGLASSGGASNGGALYSYDPTSVTDSELVVHSFSGGSDGASPQGGLVAVGSKLFGTTSTGATGNLGAVFSYDVGTSTYATALYAFAGGSDGGAPMGTLLLANDGNLYGETSTGGAGNGGVVFAFNPTTNAESVVYAFTGSAGDGVVPVGALTQTSDGTLYGVTSGGGTGNAGVLFAIN